MQGNSPLKRKMEPWIFLAIAKMVVVCAAGIAFVSWNGAKAQEAAVANAAKNKEDVSPPLPVIPKDLSSLTEAERIRVNLELIRSDAEAKIRALAKARQAYEKSKKDVDVRLKEVKEQKGLLEDSLLKEKVVKEERLKEALVFVEKMEPRKSAPLIEAMDRDLVIALFKKLPPKVVTRILENVSPRKATELMEFYTRIRSGREFALLRELGLCKDPDAQSGAATGAKPAEGGSLTSAAPVASGGTPPNAPGTTKQNEPAGEKKGDDKATASPTPAP
jgi:flagellar motility protein MotE (MotC chaperone)